MPWRRLLKCGFIAGAVLSGQPAVAQSLLPNTVVSASGIYFSAGADYRQISMPSFSLGAHSFDASFSDQGPVQTFKPRVSGASAQGTIGLVLPSDALPAVFGSNIRIGLTGSFTQADARQSGLAVINAGPITMFLDGSMAIGCGCEFSSQLTTRYSAWHLGINATSDIQTGPLTWIRSIELIGGRTRTRQTLNQTDSFEFYTSQTKLYWSDVGAKVGLGVTMPLSPAVEFGLGGTLAIVHRHVRLHGQDRLDDSLGTLFETSIGATANTWAVVPGGQAQLLFRAHPQMQVRVFGGLQWDSRVPGIVSPHFSPDQLFTFMGDPASIGFSGQTSYFVGGGLTYAFTR